jgi:hypothetical protein
MDPLTAWAQAVKAIAEMITEIVKGQPPEVRTQMWEWWVADQARMRRFFKVDE